MPTNNLTIVTPSFEKHFVQYKAMLDSIVRHCTDIDQLDVVLVVEKANHAMFDAFLATLPLSRYEIVLTEDVLEDFLVPDSPAAFLKRVGKFTFQTIKKFGGLKRAQTDWSLVLDSEGLFINDFSAAQLLADYAAQKYVFYTDTAARGPFWNHSTGFQVNHNTGEALAMVASRRWYMESFHWFYETAKVHDLLKRLNGYFWNYVAGRSKGHKDYFENILYYNYLEKYHAKEYRLIDFVEAVKAELPPSISQRFRLDQLPFSLFGNDYLLNIVQPSEVALLAPLFARYKLPFIRLEPPIFDHTWFEELRRLPSLIATISSHHQIWLNKKIAVCISGEFRHDIHRTTEQQVANIKSFLSGVDCDIFVHSWANTSEALILHGLQPRAYCFEERPELEHIERRIRIFEPDIKPGRDAGSLAMFYGLQRSFELTQPFRDEYDYVVRIRPDLYCDRSLKDVMVSISDQGDLLPECIYVPKSFHSKGVNDQIAIGRVERMEAYFHTFDFIEANVEQLYFNPEAMLLRNLLDHETGIALMDLPYALMRHAPFRVDVIHAIMQEQERVWWSSTSNLPPFRDLGAYFTDKLRGMDSAGTGALPAKLYLPVAGRFAKRFGEVPGVLEARLVDNKPSREVVIYWQEDDAWNVSPYRLEDGSHEFEGAPIADVFCFLDGTDVVMSEWTCTGATLTNDRLVFPADELDTLEIPTEPEKSAAWDRRKGGHRPVEQPSKPRPEQRREQRREPRRWRKVLGL